MKGSRKRWMSRRMRLKTEQVRVVKVGEWGLEESWRHTFL